MASIYENAHVTLCATGAADGATGLMLDRTSVHTIKKRGSKAFTIHARQMLSHAIFEISIFSDDNDMSMTERGHRARSLPAQTRAWILQEQILSKRVVHFTEEELIWDCFTEMACECGFYHNDAWLMRPFSTFKQNVLWGLRNTKKANAQWSEIVQSYVRREISKDCDRLPALSCLAHRFEESAGAELGQYYAGMWECGLERDLLWSTPVPGRRARGHEGDIFVSNPPSWSWASVESRTIAWPSTLNTYDPMTDHFNVKTYQSTSNAKVIVSGGHILLRGRILPFVVTWSDTTSATSDSSQMSHRGTYALTLLMNRNVLDSESQSQTQDEISCDEKFGYIYPDVPLFEDKLSSGDTIYFLHIANANLVTSAPGGTPQGLFVTEVLLEHPPAVPDWITNTGDQSNVRVFRRIGCGGLPSVDAIAILDSCPGQKVLLV
jgi:hypothetical protein